MAEILAGEAKEALLRSGYLLESRLDSVLRDQGFYVEANRVYLDPDTGKARELDLYAMNARRAGPGEMDYLFNIMLIECQNNPLPIALITKETVLGFLHYMEIKMAGVPVKMPEHNYWISLGDYLDIGKYHHYSTDQVATQWCTFTRKKGTTPGEWMASHDEAHFDSLRKLAAATEYFGTEHFQSWVFEGDEEPVNLEVYYPILVVQGELYDARPSKRSVRLLKANHVQFRLSTLTSSGASEYQIDVVTERFFPTYLKIVEAEMAKTSRLLSRRHKAIRRSIDKIVTSARRLRSPEKLREALDF